MADLRVVPKTQGRRGVGNSVEEKTLKTRQKGINMRKKKVSMPPLGHSEGVTGMGEAANER